MPILPEHFSLESMMSFISISAKFKPFLRRSLAEGMVVPITPVRFNPLCIELFVDDIAMDLLSRSFLRELALSFAIRGVYAAIKSFKFGPVIYRGEFIKLYWAELLT